MLTGQVMTACYKAWACDSQQQLRAGYVDELLLAKSNDGWNAALPL
jgi:hypothetical protein